MVTFADIVDAADQLSLDEQENLIELLRHRVAARARARLLADIHEADADFESGAATEVTVDELMGEISRDS
ncbi:hypothetical protein [Aeoliella sp. SH292]|uniref:hypothetical protein n=1 Tax=Aeoliella sp. SH292 TaxID=3454464 RepID=UPI003F9DBC71